LEDALQIARRENSKKRQQHPDKERKQIAWVMWRDDENVTCADQSIGSGLGQRTIGRMRTLYNKMLGEFGWTREELLTKDWAGVLHLYHQGPRQALTEEEQKRKAEHEAILQRLTSSGRHGNRGSPAGVWEEALTQPRRALEALRRNYGSEGYKP